MTTLLLGTTGMLTAAAAHAVARSKKAVLVSRHADTFSFNNDVLDHKITPINVSYDDEAAFLDALLPHAPFDLALTWLHPPADILRAGHDRASRAAGGGHGQPVAAAGQGRRGVDCRTPRAGVSAANRDHLCAGHIGFCAGRFRRALADPRRNFRRRHRANGKPATKADCGCSRTVGQATGLNLMRWRIFAANRAAIPSAYYCL